MCDVRDDAIVLGLARLLEIGAEAMQSGFAVLEFDAASGRVEHLVTRRTLADALAFVAEDFQAFARSCEDATGQPPDNLLRQTVFVCGPGKLERVIRYRPGGKLPLMSICDSTGNELQTLKA